MKIRKTAAQQNFGVDTQCYTERQLARMKAAGTISNLPFGIDKDHLVVYACDLKEIKVVCEDGFYATVAITKNDEKIYVEI